MKKQYLDYAGLKRVLKRLLPGARKIWHGTEAEWEALSETERDKYDQAEVIDAITDPEANLNPRPDWANAIAVTAAQIYAGYTAPEDGMLVGPCGAPSGNNTCIFTINGVIIARSVHVDNVYYNDTSLNVMVPEGDILKSSIISAVSVDVHFVPWKGPYAE